MTVKLRTEYNFEFLSLKGDCTGLSESTLVKMPHCWKSHVVAHLPFVHDTFLQNNGFSSSLSPQSFSPSQRYRLSRQTFLFGHLVCPAEQFLTADNKNNMGKSSKFPKS